MRARFFGVSASSASAAEAPTDTGPFLERKHRGEKNPLIKTSERGILYRATSELLTLTESMENRSHRVTNFHNNRGIAIQQIIYISTNSVEMH